MHVDLRQRCTQGVDRRKVAGRVDRRHPHGDELELTQNKQGCSTFRLVGLLRNCGETVTLRPWGTETGGRHAATRLITLRPIRPDMTHMRRSRRLGLAVPGSRPARRVRAARPAILRLRRLAPRQLISTAWIFRVGSRRHGGIRGGRLPLPRPVGHRRALLRRQRSGPSSGSWTTRRISSIH